MKFVIGPKNENFDFGYNIAYFCGYHPKRRHLRYKMVYFYNVVGSIILLCFAVQQSVVTRNRIADFVQNFESASVFVMVFSKFIVPSALDQHFAYFIDKSVHFWQTTDCPKAVHQSVTTILGRSLLLQRVYFFFGGATAVLVIIIPFILKGAVLPFGTADDFPNFRYVIQFIQSTLLPLWSAFAMSTDCMFIGLSVNMICQFRLLNYRIRNLDFRKNSSRVMEEIRTYAMHHNFLTEYCKTLQVGFSPVMLMQCLTSITILCSEMYMIRASGLNPAVITRCLFMYSVILLEAAIYCVFATLVEVEAADTIHAAYDSNWYEDSRLFPSKSLVTVMTRCQRRVSYSAAGMMDVNFQTLLKVVRVSYSICTLLTVISRKTK